MKIQLNAWQLKIIAIIGMIIQHTALTLDITTIEIAPAIRTLMIMAGGLTFPIIAYLLTEGYKHTSNVKKYILRMLVFACISQLPYYLWLGQVHNTLYLNVMFTLALGLTLIVLYNKMARPLVSLGEEFKASGKTWKGNTNEVKENRRTFIKQTIQQKALINNFLYWLMFAVILVFSVFLEWGIVGLPVILMYHMIKTEKLRRTIPAVSIISIIAVLQITDLVLGYADTINTDIIIALAGVCIAARLLTRFNGERGKHSKVSKWLFYAMYPAHLIVLAGAIALIG